MYPSIKLLLSLTICVSWLGFTPTLTLCYCRTCLREAGREGWGGGGIRFRLTVRESEAGLVQHLLSRWWRKSEDWVHSWNSKHVLPSYCVCTSSLPMTFCKHAHTEGQMHTVLLRYEFQGHPQQSVIIVERIYTPSIYFLFSLIYMVKYLESFTDGKERVRRRSVKVL